MQLHACLLLFVITTDKTLALSHHRCGEDVSLDPKPAGHINLTLPGLFTDTQRLNRSEETPLVSICTWTIDVPLGWTVHLKLVWQDGGSNVSVRCVWSEDGQILEKGGAALLSGCDRNKATLTWTVVGQSSNAIQLSYRVQEDKRNSSEDHTSPHSDHDLSRWSQTGTSFTSTAPVGQDAANGREGGRGRLYEGLESSFGPQSVSSPSSQDLGRLHPTSPLQGLAVAGRADRETLPLPEEEPNNRADTSGAAHLTDGPASARERTPLYFQHDLGTDTPFNAANTNSNNKLTQTSELSTISQAHPSVSSSSIAPLTSSPPELSSWTVWESSTVLSSHVGDVSGAPGEKPPHSWRSQRSTDRLNSDLTSAVTSDPLKSPTDPQHDDPSGAHSHTEPASPSPSSSKGSDRIFTTHVTRLDVSVGTVEAASLHPNTGQTDSLVSAASHVSSQTSALEPTKDSDNTEILHASTSLGQSPTNPPQSSESVTHSSAPSSSSSVTQISKEEKQTATQSTQRHLTNFHSSSSDVATDLNWTLSFTESPSTPGAALTLGDEVQASSATADTESYSLRPTYALLHDSSPTNPQTPAPDLSSSTSTHSLTPSHTLQTHNTFTGGSHFAHTPPPLPATTAESAARTPLIGQKSTGVPSQISTIKSTSSHTPHVHNNLPLETSTNVPATPEQSQDHITTTHTTLLSLTTAKSDYRHGDEEVGVEREDESWQWLLRSTTAQTPTAEPPQRPLAWATPQPSRESRTTLTASVLTSATSQTPKFFIVPDQAAAIRVESIELLLQIIVEESRSAFTSGLEEDTAAWVEPYIEKAPGFIRLLGVWSSGHAVQSLLEFKTSGALQWVGMTGPKSLLERTGLAQAVREGRSFRSSKITNITLGGLQGDVCDWLLHCQEGYKCVSQPGTSNYSCSSVCHFDYCHHHGICTHHPGQLPVCRCLVGEDFWYMGQRCDVRMTRARLVGACLAILLIMVTVIGVLAFVAVRRYRAILIQAKVDQTRSSYRRFNHFDELSGRFWLRSWAGSADSLDNPAFTRSDELLHLRALDRPCCYHDDTLSLASTCPSHGTRINTIYPHSSQYGWRGSEMSMGDGVLDSGKASDLSVCSWPVEPIQWTPFPLLQQLATHRTPTVRMSRPRSYCEGMELVDMGKSWTA